MDDEMAVGGTQKNLPQLGHNFVFVHIAILTFSHKYYVPNSI
jgi:hypothetical protein